MQPQSLGSQEARKSTQEARPTPFPPLPPEMWADRDLHRRRIAEHYIPLLTMVATPIAQYLAGAFEIRELANMGYPAIDQCISRYDPARGAFQTFATPRIRGEIWDAVRRLDFLPRRQRQRNPDFRIMQLPHTQAPHADDDWFREDRPDPALAAVDERDTLARFTRGLRPVERSLIHLYYVESLSMREVGAALGVSESRISQLHARLIRQFKARFADTYAGLHRRAPTPGLRLAGHYKNTSHLSHCPRRSRRKELAA